MQKNLAKAKNVSPFIKEACCMHTQFKLCGMPINALSNISDNLLFYLLSILKNEPILTPRASLDEWSKLFTFFKVHRMLPLVYWKTGHLPYKFRPPEPIFSYLREEFMANRLRCIQMERQLLELINAFQKAGVRMLVLKGPALAWTAYPNPATRFSRDLDILVAAEHIIQAREILNKINYQCESKIFEKLKHFYYDEHFIPQTDSKNKRIIELHWELHRFYGYQCDDRTNDLFSRSIEVETPSLTFETLHPLDAFIHAALHMIMTHNQSIQLNWVYDISLLAQNLSIPDDWGGLRKKSSAWGARLAVEHSLKMAQIWTGLQLPKGFNDFSTWPKPKKAEIVAITNAIQRYEKPANLLKLYLSKTHSLSKKFHVLFKLLFPDPSYMRNTYPPSCEWLLPLSYLRRLWRWW